MATYKPGPKRGIAIRNAENQWGMRKGWRQFFSIANDPAIHKNVHGHGPELRRKERKK